MGEKDRKRDKSERERERKIGRDGMEESERYRGEREGETGEKERETQGRKRERGGRKKKIINTKKFMEFYLVVLQSGYRWWRRGLKRVPRSYLDYII